MIITHLLWDWNGTLFNDVDLCIKTINSILVEEKVCEINKIEYREKFCFPINKYYENVGLNLDDDKFNYFSSKFIERYQPQSIECNLVENAEIVLKRVYEMGVEQIILSASHKKYLEEQVSKFGIRMYFNELLGLDNIYAKSKKEIGLKWKEKMKVCGENMLVVGDTFHDYEVAQYLNAQFIYYSQGHQKINSEEIKNVKKINNLVEVIECISKYI